MSIIADFKKPDQGKIKNEKEEDDDDRESNFSVFLQCVESEIFIDNILIPLRDQAIVSGNYKCRFSVNRNASVSASLITDFQRNIIL